jgi:hypothetical protein
MLLHNYIIDQREEDDTEDADYCRNFQVNMDSMQCDLTRHSGEVARALTADNNARKKAGRPSCEEAELRRLGHMVRQQLTVKLAASGIRRPLQHDMHYNSHGNVCIG